MLARFWAWHKACNNSGTSCYWCFQLHMAKVFLVYLFFHASIPLAFGRQVCTASLKTLFGGLRSWKLPWKVPGSASKPCKTTASEYIIHSNPTLPHVSIHSCISCINTLYNTPGRSVLNPRSPVQSSYRFSRSRKYFLMLWAHRRWIGSGGMIYIIFNWLSHWQTQIIANHFSFVSSTSKSSWPIRRRTTSKP